ncbi:hypothetical protein TWF481_004853 [Arthrobotrys musiformis]|uniref:Uncharacterized protein n=1 Tax=Arthrobotrys musiformis TaxID=47236 RepID=A0AAV9WKT0_9PEZI
MSSDEPVDVFSPPGEQTKKLVLERKPAAAAPTAASTPSSPGHYTTYTGPHFSRPRRFAQQRKMGMYEKIHEEWVRKALLRQEKDLKWDPETGEPLFKVGREEEDGEEEK